MPSHFSSLGFEVRDESELVALAERLAARATAVEARAGTYLRWTDASGAEIWLQVIERRIVGINPHFEGPARLRARLTNRVERTGHTALDGAFHAWAEPEPGEAHRLYPFVFDCPCAAAYETALPAPAVLQIAAFAHEIDVYPSLEAFESAGRARDAAVAARSFVPDGLFRSDGESHEPRSTAVFTGTVLASGRRENGVTGVAFHWARVASLGGEFDVVVDPALAAEPPPVGGVVAGSFWLSAKLGDG